MCQILLCIVLFISACVAPQTKPHSPPAIPETSNRGQERWRMLYERTIRYALEESYPHSADDGSLVLEMDQQSLDPMFDDDMRIVEICRRALAKDDETNSLTRNEWTTLFTAFITRVSLEKAHIENTNRESFHSPEMISPDAWCFWYIRDVKRRELVVDPTTRAISQSSEWK